MVLIAGGIGITPLLSMLNEITETGSRRETWLFYGVRGRGDHLMKEHLENLSRKFANVHLHVSYSFPTEQDRAGTDYHHAGHITIGLLKQMLPSNNCQFYLCGPPPMMSALTVGLREWAVLDQKVHLEAFGAASVQKTAAALQTASAKPEISVVFARSGKTFPWSGKEQSLLEFAEAAGVSIDCGCRAGNCGTCKTTINAGEITYLKEPGCGVEAGNCLACICVPKTDLVLEA